MLTPRSRTPGHSEHGLDLALCCSPRCSHPASCKGSGSLFSPLILSHPWAVKVVNLSRQRLRFCNPEKQGRHKVYKVTQGVGRVAPSLFTKNKVTETSYLRILWGQNISLLKQVNLNINQKNRPQSFESWSVLIQLGPPHVLTISRHSFNLTLVLPPDFTFHLPINSLWILLLSSSMKHFGGAYYRHSTLLGSKRVPLIDSEVFNLLREKEIHTWTSKTNITNINKWVN